MHQRIDYAFCLRCSLIYRHFECGILQPQQQQLLPKIGVDCGKCGQRGVVADNDGDMPSNQSDNCFSPMLIDDLQSSVCVCVRCVYLLCVCVKVSSQLRLIAAKATITT